MNSHFFYLRILSKFKTEKIEYLLFWFLVHACIKPMLLFYTTQTTMLWSFWLCLGYRDKYVSNKMWRRQSAGDTLWVLDFSCHEIRPRPIIRVLAAVMCEKFLSEPFSVQWGIITAHIAIFWNVANNYLNESILLVALSSQVDMAYFTISASPNMFNMMVLKKRRQPWIHLRPNLLCTL